MFVSRRLKRLQKIHNGKTRTAAHLTQTNRVQEVPGRVKSPFWIGCLKRIKIYCPLRKSILIPGCYL